LVSNPIVSLLHLTMKAASTMIVGVAAWEDIVNRVNAGGHSWTAAVPDKFESVEHVKPFLGAFLPGDAKYQTPAVKEVFTNGDLPESFDSAENWPKCSVIANVRDQSSCGSCWAFGSVSSFESRACISTGNDVKYSPEETAFCSGYGFGCQGGNTAWDYFKSDGVVTGGDYTDIGSDDTCYPYSLAPCAHHVPASEKYPACPADEYPSPSCKTSCTEGGYSKSYSDDKLKADSTYSVRGESQIMTELVNNGPLYVAFSVYDDFPTYKSGVYRATSSNFLGGHAVTLVGYGTLNGDKYWKIKNSWNEQWGDAGHFLIARGTDECGIEDDVNAGTIGAAPAPSPPQPPSPPTPTPTPVPTPSGCVDEEDSYYCDYVVQQGWCDLIGSDCLKSCNCCDNPSDCGGNSAMKADVKNSLHVTV